MKRTHTNWILLALTAFLLLTPISNANDKKKTVKGSKAPKVESSGFSSNFFGAYVPAPEKVDPTTVDHELVKDLVDILNSTDAPTTFALTVMALEQLGDKAKGTVPSIIRNAERLKIFSGANAVAPPNTLPSKKQQLANAVAQSIVNLLNGNRNSALGYGPPVAARMPVMPAPLAPPYAAPPQTAPLVPAY